MIVFAGEASFDAHATPANNNPAYFKKYKSGMDALKSAPEEFDREYSTAIRIKPAEVRGWV